jgi:hypothetical protein
MPSTFADVAQCAPLKHLSLRSPSLHSPSLYGDRFFAFFTSPSMRQLESLALHSLYFGAVPYPQCPPVPLADYTPAFASLRSLHTLTLADCFDLDSLLPRLVAAENLRRLIVHCRSQSTVDKPSPPSAPVLLQLLAAALNLSCTLILISDAKSPPVAPQLPSFFQMGFAPVQAAVGGRFSMLFR